MTLRAPRANESFARLFKGGGVQRQSLWPPAAAGGTLLCLFERRRGSKGEPSPGVPPFIFSLGACAPLRWEVVDGLSCLSTPFLWCLPKETVSSRQRKALFYLGGSTIRVSATASVDGTFLARLCGGAGGCRSFVRVRRFVGRWIVAPTANSTPFLCSCAKKRGGAPKKRAFGCRHGTCSVPPASPTDSKPQHPHRLRQADLSARSTHQPPPQVGRR